MTEGKDDSQDVEDDAMDVEHFLTEPSHDPVSVNDFFYKSQDLNIGGSESVPRRGGGSDEKCQVKLSEGLHVDNHNAFGSTSVCEEYLIDSEFVDKDSECDDIPCKGLSFEKSNSDIDSSDYSGSESSAVRVSESSSISNGKHGFRNGTNDSRDRVRERIEQKSPIMYTSQNRRKLQSRLGLMNPEPRDSDLASFSDLHRDSEEASIISNPRKARHFSSASHTIIRSNDSDEDKHVKNFTESSSQKRSRKPPVRYIDEFTSNVSLSDEKNMAYDMPVDTILNVKTSADNRKRTLKSFKPSRPECDYGRSPNKSLVSNRVARELSNRVSVGLSKEFSPVTRLDSDEESDSDTPVNLTKNGFRNSGDRRKHQKSWTLPEVEKLVDGISHYGVGHWTEIQRVFFPATTSRTPVDLRDKWRNLLKASSAIMQNDQEERDEESLKNGHRQLPIEVLHRISELSRLHPYPIKRTPNHKRAPKYHSKRK